MVEKRQEDTKQSLQRQGSTVRWLGQQPNQVIHEQRSLNKSPVSWICIWISWKLGFWQIFYHLLFVDYLIKFLADIKSGTWWLWMVRKMSSRSWMTSKFCHLFRTHASCIFWRVYSSSCPMKEAWAHTSFISHSQTPATPAWSISFRQVAV